MEGENNGYITKVLECCDCSGHFEWSAKDQATYAEKKYNAPKRCRECRLMKKEKMLAQKNKIIKEPTYR